MYILGSEVLTEGRPLHELFRWAIMILQIYLSCRGDQTVINVLRKSCLKRVEHVVKQEEHVQTQHMNIYTKVYCRQQ